MSHAPRALPRVALSSTLSWRLRTVADRVEERFLKPLALDRLCALVKPAMAEARAGEKGATFARLEVTAVRDSRVRRLR